jgi:uncharacterized protein (DUF736 family)
VSPADDETKSETPSDAVRRVEARQPVNPNPQLDLRNVPSHRIGAHWNVLPSHPLEGEYVDMDMDALRAEEEAAIVRREETHEDKLIRWSKRHKDTDPTDSEEEAWEYETTIERRRKKYWKVKLHGPKVKQPKNDKRIEQAEWYRRRNDPEYQKEIRDRTRHINSPGPSLVVNDVPAPRITSMDREFLVAWKKKREAYESKINAMGVRMGSYWDKAIQGWIESTDDEMLSLACEFTWKIKRNTLDENRYKELIMDIIGRPAND